MHSIMGAPGHIPLTLSQLEHVQCEIQHMINLLLALNI
jgi:hypothetical protein